MPSASKSRSLLPDALRKQWARFFLHDVHFADRHEKLDALYRIRDPWELETEAQRFRFRETNRLIAEQFGRVGSLLEIGCGEGHQSEHLLQVCDELVGIDVSGRAVERARVRCPQATFLEGDVSTAGLDAGARFDLVVACEVLYYVKDVAAELDRLGRLGRGCLVTYYARPAHTLDPHVLAIDGVESTTVQYGSSSWTIAWWRRPTED
ncbi:MAG: methyltransferase domain-containing protein [Solirubrobacterales bacterium]|nr:methyltransferase domain-containing protein [Solirubrobacterales bacterium]